MDQKPQRLGCGGRGGKVRRGSQLFRLKPLQHLLTSCIPLGTPLPLHPLACLQNYCDAAGQTCGTSAANCECPFPLNCLGAAAGAASGTCVPQCTAAAAAAATGSNVCDSTCACGPGLTCLSGVCVNVCDPTDVTDVCGSAGNCQCPTNTACSTVTAGAELLGRATPSWLWLR